ncbi:hypothetical protein, partial [Phenylobacterium sp.]
MRTTANEPSVEGLDRRTLLGVAAGAALSAGFEAQAATTITGMSAVALARAIRTKAVSCVEVMGAYLDQIERL